MKKKIIALCVCVMMLTVAIAGGTLAYFTDDAAQTNTFTAGKVEITLTEAEVEEDEKGDLVSTDERTSENQEYKLFPGQTVTKDPTITLSSDSEDAYVAAVVTIKDNGGDIASLLKTTDDGKLNIGSILSGGLLPVSAETPYRVDNGTYTFYFLVEDVKSANDEVVVFDTLSIPPQWDNEDMAKINNMSITVEAYAAQAHGFDSCSDAMSAAFPEVFDFGEE